MQPELKETQNGLKSRVGSLKKTLQDSLIGINSGIFREAPSVDEVRHNSDEPIVSFVDHEGIPHVIEEIVKPYFVIQHVAGISEQQAGEISNQVGPIEVPTEIIDDRNKLFDFFRQKYAQVADMVVAVSLAALAVACTPQETHAQNNSVRTEQVDTNLPTPTPNATPTSSTESVTGSDSSTDDEDEQSRESNLETETGLKAAVLAEVLNVRSNPEVDGTNQNVVGSLERYDEVEILEEVETSDGPWLKILFNGKTAYITADERFVTVMEKRYGIGGGQTSEEELLEVAKEVIPGVDSIDANAEEGPIAYDSAGNIVGKLEDGRWVKVSTSNESQSVSEESEKSAESEGEKSSVQNAETLVAEAKEINNQVAQVVTHNGITYGLSEKGFPLVEKKGEVWQAIETVSYDQLSQSSEEIDQMLITDVPNRIAYADENNNLITHEFTDQTRGAIEFAKTELGNFMLMPLPGVDDVKVMHHEDTEIRGGWYEDMFESERIKITKAGIYDEIHPRRDVLTEGNREYIGEIRSGSVAEVRKNQEMTELMIDNPDSVQWLKDVGTFSADQQPGQRDKDYEEGELINREMAAFWSRLESEGLVEDDKVYFPRLGKTATIDQIEARICRFSDRDSNTGYYRSPHTEISYNIGQYPNEFYKIVDEKLIVDICQIDSSGWYLSSTFNGALSMILYDEFNLEPDNWDLEIPLYNGFGDTFLGYDKITQENGSDITVTVPALSVTVASEQNRSYEVTY